MLDGRLHPLSNSCKPDLVRSCTALPIGLSSAAVEAIGRMKASPDTNTCKPNRHVRGCPVVKPARDSGNRREADSSLIHRDS
jgi:hypothetical protein